MEDENRHKLIKLCQTRFADKHVSVDHFCEKLPAVNHVLQFVARWNDSSSSSKAAMLHNSICRTEFMVGAVIAGRLAGILRPLALSLQEKRADPTMVLVLVDAVQIVLQQLYSASEEEFLMLMTKVEALTQELGVKVRKPSLVDRSVYYRVNAFIPALVYIL